MTSMESAPEGWYPDTEATGTKYWDGGRWTGDTRPARKGFAAASGHKVWGVVLIFVGALFAITSPTSFAPSSTSTTTSGSSGVVGFIVALLIGLGFVVWGVYLVRGQGVSTKSASERAHASIAFESALEHLRGEAAASAAPRAALVTGFLGLQAAATRRFGVQAAPDEVAKALASIGFDAKTISTPVLAQVPGLSVYRDWMVTQTSAYDLRPDTRAQFHLDDRVQTVTTSKGKGKKVVSTSVEVPRGGQLQVVTSDGSQFIQVAPNQVANARALAELINIRADQLKGSAAMAAHGKSTAEAERIKAIANPETAKALQNLQSLLYTRVISDDEFARMKAKLLADPDSVS